MNEWSRPHPDQPYAPAAVDAPADLEPEPSLAGFPPPAPPTQGYGYGHGWSPPAVPAGYGPGFGPAQVAYGAPLPDQRSRSQRALPTEPREYHQLLRGPQHRWWRPVLAWVLAALITAVLAVAAIPVTALVGWLVGRPDVLAEIQDVANLGPVGFLYVNLSIISFIPASVLAIWIAYGVRPRFVASVAGGIRWPWLLRCVAVLVPVWILYLGSEVLLGESGSDRPPQWPILLAMVLVLTPFQAAAEEYLTRGFLTQTIGSLIPHPLVGLVVAALVSAAVFSALHLSVDPWVVGTLVVFALTSSIATWRTGGLEAGIAIHTVNNVGVFFLVLTVGGWNEAFISEGTTGTPVMLAIALVVHAVALALILWQARRAKIDRWFRPATDQSRVAITS